MHEKIETFPLLLFPICANCLSAGNIGSATEMCNRASSPPLPLSVLLGRNSASRTGGQAARRRFWTMFQTFCSQFATGVCKRHSMRRCRGGSGTYLLKSSAGLRADGGEARHGENKKHYTQAGEQPPPADTCHQDLPCNGQSFAWNWSRVKLAGPLGERTSRTSLICASKLAWPRNQHAGALNLGRDSGRTTSSYTVSRRPRRWRRGQNVGQLGAPTRAVHHQAAITRDT
jgi:hypothetical protein